mgnify:CR=1 FL=1|jgi:hypothetical protein
MADRLTAGERLERRHFLESNNKKFKLYLRADGKVRLFKFEPGRKRALGFISGIRLYRHRLSHARFARLPLRWERDSRP